MRIGIDTRSLLESVWGGVSVYTENLLKHLFKLDTQNEYFLFYNQFRRTSKSFSDQFSYPNVHLCPFSFPNRLFNSSLALFHYPKIDRLVGGVDVFFAPNINFLALSKKIKEVITIHDLSFLLYPKFYHQKGKWWHKAIRPKRQIREFDKVIAVSENTRRDVINLLGVTSEKVVTIYSGVDKEFYQKKNPELIKKVKQKYQLPEKFILSLSALEPRKNIEIILAAFDDFKKHDLGDYHLVVGGADRCQKRKLNKKNVHFLGYIPEEEKSCLYQLASVFVYPSFYEGFGFPPLEAMASSCPVITSFSSSLSEVVGSAALLIDPYNVSELVPAIQQVLSHPEFANIMIEKGLKQVQRFSWGDTARKTLGVFESLI